RVRETHPELAFWRLNGGCPLASAKKTKVGLALRRRLLIEAGLAPAMVNGAPPKGAGPNDLLDALVCAAIAARIHRGLARPFPDPPERGVSGLRMVMWAEALACPERYCVAHRSAAARTSQRCTRGSSQMATLN